MHAWLSIEPEQDSEDEFVGIQRRITFDGLGDLNRIVGALLGDWGASSEGRIESTRHNSSLQLYASDGEYPTGLRLRIYPCTAYGTNTDVDPIEPRGE